MARAKNEQDDREAKPVKDDPEMAADTAGLLPTGVHARVPAGPLSWRPQVGDTVLVKLDETDDGRPQVAPAIVVRVRGQLPGGHRGWLVDATVFGAGGGTEACDGLALFGGPGDAASADPDSAVGWVRR